jgi:DNA topoisomerase III
MIPPSNAGRWIPCRSCRLKFKLTLIKNRGVDEQFRVIETLFRAGRTEIVCATDAGREGELIFRYILALWLRRQTDPPSLAQLADPRRDQEAFKELKDGHDYDALYAAARCRSESDWIVGLNATRYYTVRHGRIGGGPDRVLWSIGRVQTPVLAMIVERDDAILQFRPQPFWELTTRYREVVFKYTGKRFEKPEKAQVLLEKITGQPFEITGCCRQREKRAAAAALRSHHPAARNQQAARALGGRYPCRHPEPLRIQSSSPIRVPIRAISAKTCSRAFPGFWSSSNLSGRTDRAAQPGQTAVHQPDHRRHQGDRPPRHHSHRCQPHGNLGANEQLVYDAITTQFIAAFYPVCVKIVTTVDGVSNRCCFRPKARRLSNRAGPFSSPKKKQSQDAAEDQALPAFTKGKPARTSRPCAKAKPIPPKHFTENSLLGAMEAAGKLVEDDALREALKERGIGTPATRAAIIETLLSRNYIQREKKQLRCTDMGRCLIALIRTRCSNRRK